MVLKLEKVFSQTIRRIQQEQGISMSRTCRLFGISRQAIYQQEARCLEREKELLTVRQLVEKQRRVMPRLGARKLYFY